MIENKFNVIENLLSDLLIKYSNEDYLELINSNEDLKKYDEIMRKIDNGDLPSNYREQISKESLDNIINLLNEKTNSIKN